MSKFYSYIKISKYCTELVVLTKVKDDWYTLFNRKTNISLTHANYEQNIKLFPLIKEWFLESKNKLKYRVDQISFILDDTVYKRFSGSRAQKHSGCEFPPDVIHNNWANIMRESSVTDSSSAFFIEPLNYQIGNQLFESFPQNIEAEQIIYNYIECVINKEHLLNIESLCNYLNIKLNLILPNYVAHQTYISQQFPHIPNYINIDWNNEYTRVHFSKNHLCENYLFLPIALQNIIQATQVNSNKNLELIHKVLKHEYSQFILPGGSHFHTHSGQQFKVSITEVEEILNIFNDVFVNKLVEIEKIIVANSKGLDPNVPLIYTGDISKIKHIQELVQSNSHYNAYIDQRIINNTTNQYVHMSFLGAAVYEENQAFATNLKSISKKKKQRMKLFKLVKPKPNMLMPNLMTRYNTPKPVGANTHSNPFALNVNAKTIDTNK